MIFGVNVQLSGGAAIANEGFVTKIECRSNDWASQSVETRTMYEIPPYEKVEFTVILEFDDQPKSNIEDYSLLNTYRRTLRAFAGDVKYNSDLDASANISLSFKEFRSLVSNQGVDQEGWAPVAGSAEEGSFAASVTDFSNIYYANLADAASSLWIFAGSEPTELYTPNEDFLEAPIERTWYIDNQSGVAYIQLPATIGGNATNSSLIEVLTSSNPYGHYDIPVSPWHYGWNATVNDPDPTSLTNLLARDFRWCLFRRFTGEPYAHEGMSYSMIANSLDPSLCPLMAATVGDLTSFINSSGMNITAWWGRSSEVTPNINSLEADIKPWKLDDQELLDYEDRELQAIIDTGLAGFGLDAFDRINDMPTVWQRAKYLQNKLGKDFLHGR